MSKTHPFIPLVSPETKKLLVGTLPPEGVTFYFYNSSNTRLWDILEAINNGSDTVGKGGNKLSGLQKTEILHNLKLGISDIIFEYERDDHNSTQDKDIDPKKYNDLLNLALDTGIEEFLFVYQSALKWFKHSQQHEQPIRLKKIREKYSIGVQAQIEFKGKLINCTLLPAPLNRGRSGETLDFKLEFYRKHILGH